MDTIRARVKKKHEEAKKAAHLARYAFEMRHQIRTFTPAEQRIKREHELTKAIAAKKAELAKKQARDVTYATRKK